MTFPSRLTLSRSPSATPPLKYPAGVISICLFDGKSTLALPPTPETSPLSYSLLMVRARSLVSRATLFIWKRSTESSIKLQTPSSIQSVQSRHGACDPSFHSQRDGEV